MQLHVRKLNNPLCLLRLKDVTQALSLPAESQLALYPDGNCKVDELAEDFHNWWLCARSNDLECFNVDQVTLLDSIDEQLDIMSGKANAELWTEHSLRQSPHWARMRSLALLALSALGWPSEIPDYYAEYPVDAREEFLTDLYKQVGWVSNSSELWLSHADALHFIDNCEGLGITILGMDFLQERDSDVILLLTTADYSVLFGKQDAVRRSATAARQLLKEGLPEGADWVTFVLE